MNGSKVIRMLLEEKEMSIQDLAELLEIQPQSMRNKLTRNSFSLKEFDRIIELLGAELVTVSPSGNKYK